MKLLLLIPFLMFITTAKGSTNLYKINPCDTINFKNFKNNLLINHYPIDSTIKDQNNHFVKKFSYYYCQTQNILCENLKLVTTKTYEFEQWDLFLFGFQTEGTVTDKNLPKIYVLTIYNQDKFIHNKTFADLEKGIELELNGFDYISGDKFIIWGKGNPKSKPEFGRFRLQVDGLFDKIKYECK